MNTFMQNLKYYRCREHISQAMLAEKLHVTSHTIANYESGRTEPSMEMVIRIAHALDVTTDQLLGYNVPVLNENSSHIH